MVTIELFKPEKHYETICKWWGEQNWPVVPLSHLPQTGVVVSYDGKLSAATWIYKSDSAICWMEWIVASPEIRHEARASVLSALISSTKVIATIMGFQSIFTSIRNQALAHRIEQQGFAATDQGMTNYVFDIQGGS